MTGSLKLFVDVAETPENIYAAWLSSEGHSRLIGGAAAIIDARVGGRHTAWDDYISGETLELEDGRRIVQSWRTTDFPHDAPDSRVEVSLVPIDGGTRITVLHTEIPEGQVQNYEKGWVDFYFTPMTKLFGKPVQPRAWEDEVTTEAPAAPIDEDDEGDGPITQDAPTIAPPSNQPLQITLEEVIETPAPKKAAPKKAAPKKAAKKAAPKKAAPKKAAPKKAAPKKAAPKKAAPKKAAPKKAAPKKAAPKKAAPKKAAPKKAAPKKAAPKKAAPKKKR